MAKLQKHLFVGIVLMIVILLFTIIDHFLHSLENSWSVPDYYFKNKIIFAFLWGVVGLFAARRIEKLWLKAFVVSSIISVTLQTRYFIEGYNLNFVLLFLLFHFIILYILSLIMFRIFKRYIKN